MWNWKLPTRRCTPLPKKTIALKSGARGLRSVMEQALIGVMFDIPSDDIIS